MESQGAVCAEADAANPAICIRKAEIGDARPLAVLMSQLGYPSTEDEMADRLRLILPRSDYLMAVAVREGQVVGVVGALIGLYLEMNGRYGRVTALSVAADHRGQGIGTRLLAHAESWLGTGGATACIVNSGSHRADAHRFYQRKGYQATGVRFHKDLLILWERLSSRENRG